MYLHTLRSLGSNIAPFNSFDLHSIAVRVGNATFLSSMLRRGVTPDRHISDIFCASSSSSEQSECMRLLARAGADLNGFDELGQIPLHFACDNGNADCVL